MLTAALNEAVMQIPSARAADEPYLCAIERNALNPAIARVLMFQIEHKLHDSFQYEGDIGKPSQQDSQAVYLLKAARSYLADCASYHDDSESGFNPEKGMKKWLTTAGISWDRNDSMGKILIPALHFAYTDAVAIIEGKPPLKDHDRTRLYQMPVPYKLPSIDNI